MANANVENLNHPQNLLIFPAGGFNYAIGKPVRNWIRNEPVKKARKEAREAKKAQKPHNGNPVKEILDLLLTQGVFKKNLAQAEQIANMAATNEGNLGERIRACIPQVPNSTEGATIAVALSKAASRYHPTLAQ